MIPKLSNPLSKAIRTTEGILVSVINVALLVGAAIPHTGLSPEVAGILASVNTGLLVASRTSLKLSALSKGLGLDPIPALGQARTGQIGKALGDVAAAVTTDVGATPNAATVETQIDQGITDAQELADPPPAVAEGAAVEPAATTPA